jgi:hypothetical protein
MLGGPGCDAGPADDTEAWTKVDPAEAGGATADALQRAADARAALFQRLSGRLTEVVAAEGPVAAIRVCRDEAPDIARTVGEEQGLRIGRTGVRLRNPDNTPPAWAAAAVAARADERSAWVRQDDTVAELSPILLAAQCVACHGTPEALAPGVAEALAELYPEDQATGFAEGELRGWFWVEVPAES